MSVCPAKSVAPHACVIGWPISHSRSPLVHGYWLETLGIPGSYTKCAVAPEDLASVFADLRSGALVGCNVTIPHKQAVLPLLDEVLPEAKALGAVNTIWREGTRLVGTSTDGDGFLAHLDASAPGWRTVDGEILIVGAGGAARAIGYVLQRERTGDIVITNRTAARATALVETLTALRPNGAAAPQAVAWHRRADAVQRAKLIVNTTALGMSGQPPLTLDLAAAHSSTVVADIVYAPLNTPLLVAAQQRHLRTVDGVGMLLHQAAPGFEKWFGVRPQVTPELRAVVEADLAQSSD